MRPLKIDRHYKLRPNLITRAQEIAATYDLTETETIERALEFGLSSLARFLTKNKNAQLEAIEQARGAQPQENDSQPDQEAQRVIEIAKAKWLAED